VKIYFGEWILYFYFFNNPKLALFLKFSKCFPVSQNTLIEYLINNNSNLEFQIFFSDVDLCLEMGFQKLIHYLERVLINRDFKDQYYWKEELGKYDCYQECQNIEFVNIMWSLTSKINNFKSMKWIELFELLHKKVSKYFLARQCTLEEQGTYSRLLCGLWMLLDHFYRFE